MTHRGFEFLVASGFTECRGFHPICKVSVRRSRRLLWQSLRFSYDRLNASGLPPGYNSLKNEQITGGIRGEHKSYHTQSSFANPAAQAVIHLINPGLSSNPVELLFRQLRAVGEHQLKRGKGWPADYGNRAGWHPQDPARDYHHAGEPLLR